MHSSLKSTGYVSMLSGHSREKIHVSSLKEPFLQSQSNVRLGLNAIPKKKKERGGKRCSWAPGAGDLTI